MGVGDGSGEEGVFAEHAFIVLLGAGFEFGGEEFAVGGEGLDFGGDGWLLFESGAGFEEGGFVRLVEEGEVGAGAEVEEGDPAFDGVVDVAELFEGGGGPGVGGSFVVGLWISGEGEPLGEGGGFGLRVVVAVIVPGVEGGGGAEAAVEGDGFQGEGVVAILAADAEEDGGGAFELGGRCFDLVDVAGTHDGGAGEAGFGLEEESGEPAAFAEAADVDAFGVDVVFGGEVVDDGALDGEFFGEGFWGEGELALLDVGHADREPVVVIHVSADEFGGGFAVGAVVVEEGWVFFGGVVVGGEDDLDAVGEAGEAEFEVFGFAGVEGGGEGEEEKEDAHDGSGFFLQRTPNVELRTLNVEWKGVRRGDD